eukprot:5703863-Pleurochrysis_carterae.AAC.1
MQLREMPWRESAPRREKGTQGDEWNAESCHARAHAHTCAPALADARVQWQTQPRQKLAEKLSEDQ